MATTSLRTDSLARFRRAIVRIAASCAVGVAATLLAMSDPARAQSSRLEADGALAEASRALASGDTDRALKLGTAHLSRHPRDVHGQVLLVRIHLERGEWDRAYEVASRAARAHPSNVDVLYHLGLVTRQLAAHEFDRLARIAPGSARVHQLQAETFEAQQRRAEAEKAYSAALEANPDLVEALLGLGRLKRIRLACEEAVRHYEKAEAIRPTFEGAYGHGVCLSFLQDEEAAVTRFEQAIQRAPSEATAWAGLGTSLVRLGRTTEAIQKLERAVAIEPRMAGAYYVLGTAYQAAGDRVRAQAAFARAEELRARQP